MILTKIRDLDLSPSTQASRPYLTAASGLVRVGSFLYVVADDELHLGVFRTNDERPGELIRLFEGVLPLTNPDRKKQKPDLETLMRLPPSADFPHGALLALGSGSKRHRRRTAVLALDARGAVRDAPVTVDPSPIFAPLDDAFRSVNIEGAVVASDEVHLFQRGNKKNSENAIVRFPLASFLQALHAKDDSVLETADIQTIDLGRVNEIPLCFTDAAALPDGSVVFTAVAEDTDNSYDDGACAGSAIGVIGTDGHLDRVLRLDGAHKIEGVDARLEGGVLDLLLVTDADDPDVPAALFSASMKR